ncbi:hypothetical protein GCM10027046_17480 [Uliginosibacterium flavum]|uniref:Uncharacterized protein n=1 Tax=Uliginosibacterium flavum TaxID=1396831 RepID=A0ABV2TF84_9RHOO
MEFLFELIFGFIGEFLLQILLEILAEFGLHSLREPFRRKPHPAVAFIGYGLLGALAGGLSLWLFPTLFITSPDAQLANLLISPALAGLSMAALGAWRAKRGQTLLRMDRFAYGFFFAMTMALVRYSGAQGF